jgi:hypothetical protein
MSESSEEVQRAVLPVPRRNRGDGERRRLIDPLAAGRTVKPYRPRAIGPGCPTVTLRSGLRGPASSLYDSGVAGRSGALAP